VTGAKLTVTHRQNVHTSWGTSITSEHTSSSISPEVLDDPASILPSSRSASIRRRSSRTAT
jgi:hypothetical protein